MLFDFCRKERTMQLQKCSLPEFRSRFNSEIACLKYLAELKWGKGFKCRKCEHTLSGKGDRWEDRRCQKCGYNESPTANTVFHSIKLPLVTAFEMAFRISVSKKGISGLALSREYHLNPKTAYHFRQKVQQAMYSNGNEPLEGIVHVDEFVIGGPESGCQGRSSESRKKRIVTAVEIIKKRAAVNY